MTIYILETGYLEARVADSPCSYLNSGFNFLSVWIYPIRCRIPLSKWVYSARNAVRACRTIHPCPNTIWSLSSSSSSSSSSSELSSSSNSSPLKTQMLCKLQHVRIVCGTFGVFSSSGFNRHLQWHFSFPNALSTITPLLLKILLNLAWFRLRLQEWG